MSKKSGMMNRPKLRDLQIPDWRTCSLVDMRDFVLGKGRWSQEGIDCPCCDQLARVYERKFNANMARFLITMCVAWKQSNGEWIHYKQCKFGGRDYAFVKDWALAVSATKDDVTPNRGRVSGYWKPTQKGLDFSAGRITVPTIVSVYNNTVLMQSPDSVNIQEALGKKFKYKELIKNSVF